MRRVGLPLVCAAVLSTAPSSAVAVAVASLEGSPDTVLAPPPEVARSTGLEGLEIQPAVELVELGPGRATLVEHRVSNGTGHHRRLGLRVRALEPGPSGAPRVAGAAPSGVRVDLGGEEVTLADQELARLRTVVGPLRGAGAAFALTVDAAADPGAGGSGTEPDVAALVLVGPPGVDRDVAIDAVATDRDGLEIGIANPSGAFALVDLAVRVTGLLGRQVAEVTVTDLVVWPGSRRSVRVGLDPAGLPDRWSVEVVAAHRGETAARRTVTDWRVDGRSLLVLGVAAAGVAGVVALVVVRRRRASF